MSEMDVLLKKLENSELSDDDLEQVSGGLTNTELKRRLAKYNIQ